MAQPAVPAPTTSQVLVQRESDVPQAVAEAHRFCLAHGFTPVLAAHVATAASELANNLWMHTTQGGLLQLRLLQEAARRGVEVLASDPGPGIADLALALSEGYSSAGGMGCGLPGVKRLMDDFDIDSAPGRGTRVCARKWAAAAPAGKGPAPDLSPAPAWLRVATRAQAVPGEPACGDVVADLAVPGGAGHWLLVADGLGHGALAAQAAARALQQVQQAAAAQQHVGDPAGLLRQLDIALAGGRGAAVGLLWLQPGRLRHAGVGNTRALRWRLVQGQAQVLRLPSRYGVVGDASQPGRPGAGGPASQEADLLPGDWLLLFTDGLDERLHVDLMLPEWQADPVRLCDHLMARWRQPRDDAAVLACQVLK